MTKKPEMAFTLNTITGEVTTRSWRGVEHLVAPVVAIVAGVLKGELVPAEELQTTTGSWNGRPITLAHPKDDGGGYISANDPAVLDKFQIGHLFAAEFDGNKLRGEAWIDIARANSMGPSGAHLILSLQAGTPVEVSTAYFRQLVGPGGTFNDVKYGGTALDLKPDHLAILTDTVGACSWKDGCGTPRVNEPDQNQKESAEMLANGEISVIMEAGADSAPTVANSEGGAVAKFKPALNEESLTDIDNQVRDAYYAQMSRPVVEVEPVEWVQRVTATKLIVERGNKVFWVTYERDDAGAAVTFGEPVEVEYAPVAQEAQPEQEEDEMTDLIKDVAARFGLAEADVSALPALVLNSLNSFAPPAPEAPCAQATELLDYVQERGGPEVVLAGLRAQAQSEQEAVDALIADLVKNDACTFDEDALRNFDLSTLERLSKMLAPPAKVAANYSGTPTQASNLTEDTEHVLSPM